MYNAGKGGETNTIIECHRKKSEIPHNHAKQTQLILTHPIM
jgi:hypothetical protein